MFGKDSKAKKLFKKIDVTALKKERIRLDMDLNKIRKELEKLEKRRKDLFFKGVQEKSKLSRMTISGDIQLLKKKKANLVKDYRRVNAVRMITEEIMHQKERWNDGKTYLVVDKIIGKDPASIIEMIRDKQLDELTDIVNTEDILANIEGSEEDYELDDGIQKDRIMEIWETMDAAHDEEERLKIGESFLATEEVDEEV